MPVAPVHGLDSVAELPDKPEIVAPTANPAVALSMPTPLAIPVVVEMPVIAVEPFATLAVKL